MVEPPIKKSERQAITELNDVVEAAPETEPSTIESPIDSIPQSSQERNRPQPALRKDTPKGKGREDQHKDRQDKQSNRQPGNLALMRGPKPTKPKSPVIQAPQAATESDSGDEAAEEDT